MMSKQQTKQPKNQDRHAANKSLGLCVFGDTVLLSILSLSKATFVAYHGLVGLLLLCLGLIFVVATLYGVRAILEQTALIRGMLGSGLSILSVQVIFILALIFYLLN